MDLTILIFLSLRVGYKSALCQWKDLSSQNLVCFQQFTGNFELLLKYPGTFSLFQFLVQLLKGRRFQSWSSHYLGFRVVLISFCACSFGALDIDTMWEAIVFGDTFAFCLRMGGPFANFLRKVQAGYLGNYSFGYWITDIQELIRSC